MPDYKNPVSIVPPKKYTWLSHGHTLIGYRLQTASPAGWLHMVESRGSQNPGAVWCIPESALTERVNSKKVEVSESA